MNYTLVLVSHTHWDREWYLPYQVFRIKLVNTVDKIISVLEKNPEFKYFTLDGQTIILEDYLEIKSENRDKLKRLIKSGKLIIGPWYVLQDEFLVSGESIIRNLIVGREVGEKFGKIMQIGYLPDMFGHIAQMPQILSGFGIECAVVWRGVPDKIKTSEFIWCSLSDNKIFTIYLPYGYGNAAELPMDSVLSLKEKLEKIVKDMRKFSTTPFILGMNGSDHLPIQDKLPEYLKKLNMNVEIGNLINYKDNLLNEINIKNIPEIKGELRSFSVHHLLPGVLSTRIYLKQMNFDTEALLEKKCEPFSVFSYILGKKYPEKYISLMWKYLLQNQPHDSICGCSVDDVHNEMICRYRWIKQIGETLFKESINYIADRINTKKIFSDKDKILVVFNTSQNERQDLVEIPVEDNITLKVYDETGRQILHQETTDEIDSTHKVLFVAKVPGYGYSTYGIEFKPYRKKIFKSKKKEIENEFFKVSVNRDGSLKIYDKRNKITYPVCGKIEDGGDAGDEYNFSPPEKDIIVSTASAFKCRKIEDGPIRWTLEIKSEYLIPEEISQNRKDRSKKKIKLDVVSYISLVRCVPRIDWKVKIKNTAKDHRMRITFIFPSKVGEFITETQFGTVKRSVKLQKYKKNYIEIPIGTYPQKIFTDVSCKKYGITIANFGLPEIEVNSVSSNSTKISITLFRSVGYLSRGDLVFRKGHAGPEIETPEAQCLGENIYRICLVPHSGCFIKDKTHIISYNFVQPLLCCIKDKKEGNLPEKMYFLKIEPDCLIASAIKKAEKNNDIIIRVYSISDKIEDGKITFFKKIKDVFPVDLKEDIVEDKVECFERHFTFKIKPHQIKTFKVKI